MPFSSPEGYGVAVVSIAVFVFVLRWTSRHQQVFLDAATELSDERQEEITRLRHAVWVLERQLEVLLRAMRAAGVEVPVAYFDVPSPQEPDEH